MTVERIAGWPMEYFAIVGGIRVRYVADTPRPWRCDRCGWHPTSTCPHQLAAETAAAQHQWTQPRRTVRRTPPPA